MIHDNDALFKGWLPRALKEFGLTSHPTSPQCPWQNGRVERFNLTLKTELLFRVPVADQFHALELCQKYLQYYNCKRTHQAIEGNNPCCKPGDLINKSSYSYNKQSVVDSLFTYFKVAA
jgi:transposase InsO family protein